MTFYYKKRLLKWTFCMLAQTMTLSSILEAKAEYCYPVCTPLQVFVSGLCCKETSHAQPAKTASTAKTFLTVSKTKPATQPAKTASTKEKQKLDVLQAQKTANHFVLSQWKKHAALDHGHDHYHVLASEEMMQLSKAYNNTYITRHNNGTMINTAPFTLLQVYMAYYSAVAAEGSLKTLTT